jgi:acylglycerol lipase
MRPALLALLLLIPLLAGCVARLDPEGPPVDRAIETTGFFQMPDGTRLPYRVWQPDPAPRAIIVAFHGMNDSRDAWEVPADAFTTAGIEIISPDQRGFGATLERGYWPGTKTLVDDARRILHLVHAQHPHAPLFAMGESMGGAVLMVLASSPDPPPVAGYILVSPAVWSRSEMNIFERAALWFGDHVFPGMTFTGAIAHVTATNNHAALERLSTDPLTIHHTRVDAINGLVNLMSAAQAAAPYFRAHALLLYGGKDELIPKHAMRSAWDHLPPGQRIAYYPHDYHLMLRDIGRDVPIDDILSWMFHPNAPLPSGAGSAARVWLDHES